MDGFFVTINCSKIFDSNETFYKIFIRKNEMSIVYELVEWIRFMFGLERCFFLIHENSVIHELEDITVLEILNTLEIRPCLRTNCIHKKMEKNLFHKLNLFTYWDEMKVHKLFQARCNYIIQRVSNTHHLNVQGNPDSFPLQYASNFDKSVLADYQKAFISPSKLTHKPEDDRSQVTETMSENIPNKYEWHVKKAHASSDNKNINSNEINISKEFSSKNSESLIYPISNNLKAENCDLNSSGNKKQKMEFNSSKSKKIGIPFSLGALLSNIREEAKSQKFEKDQELDQKKESFGSACSVHENTENKILHAEKTHKDLNKEILKRKRKRKHRKQNVQVDSGFPPNNLSWDYYEPCLDAKPSHIRFNDNDEAMETEATENECNSLHKEQMDFNASEASVNVNQQMVTLHLTSKSTSSVEKNESYENHQAEGEICEKFIDSNSEKPNSSNKGDNDTERKIIDDSQPNVPDLEALKQKIKHPKICLRFY